MAKSFKNATEGAIDALLQNPQQAQDEYNASDTQGQKGKKAERMNMAFSPANYEFLRVMAGIHKMTMTKYVNHLIEEERKRSADLYQKAKDLMNNL